MKTGTQNQITSDKSHDHQQSTQHTAPHTNTFVPDHDQRRCLFFIPPDTRQIDALCTNQLHVLQSILNKLRDQLSKSSRHFARQSWSFDSRFSNPSHLLQKTQCVQSVSPQTVSPRHSQRCAAASVVPPRRSRLRGTILFRIAVLTVKECKTRSSNLHGSVLQHF